MQGLKGSKGHIVQVTVEKNLYTSAQEYARSLPDPLSFSGLVSHLLRSTAGIKHLMKLKKAGSCKAK